MVPVCNVESLYTRKLLAEEVRVFHCALPEDVSDAVFACDVSIGGRAFDDCGHLSLDNLLVLLECEEDGADVRRLHISELGAVGLLLRQGVLVPLDALLLIVFD